MIGRAGRPQFDTTGVAVVMTAKSTVALYENLGTESAGTIESTLESSKSLLELLNSEISSRAVTCEEQGVAWIRSTFMVRAPRRRQWLQRRKTICVSAWRSVRGFAVCSDAEESAALSSASDVHDRGARRKTAAADCNDDRKAGWGQFRDTRWWCAQVHHRWPAHGAVLHQV